jgi:hypothetical protein
VYKIYFWVSYCRPWFLWPETKKLVIPFLRIYLIASLLSVHCVSPHRRSHKPCRISTLKTKYHFCDYLLDHNLLLIMDHQFKEDRKTVPWLKISSISLKEKYFRYLPYLYHLFARGRSRSYHGGGGRYNAILEFKGEQIKKFMRKKKRKKWENERKKNMSMRKREKRKNMSVCKNKIKWTP